MPRKKINVLIVMLLSLVVVWNATGGGQGEQAEATAEEVATVDVLDVMFWPTLQEYEQETGRKIETFSEAPMLKALVSSGALPALDARLPDELYVLNPVEEVGTYGGTLVGTAENPDMWADLDYPRREGLVMLSNDVTEVHPNLAKGFDYSNGRKTLTVYIREGVKWSDGAAYTADDVMFWWEDVILNDELTPAKPSTWTRGGKLAEYTKIDDYTFQIDFAVPTAFAHSMVNSGRPKHYLEKWHITYNSKADELAKEEGFDDWKQAFRSHQDDGPAQQDIDLPGIGAWVLESRSSTQKVYVRNPYYWKIDTQGNQLPYIDKLLCQILASKEVANMKVIAGETDLAAMNLVFKNYPLYVENEEKGDYRVLLWNTDLASEVTFAFNYTHEDPVLRELFWDVRFRRAMSMAIDRDEINEIVFYGLGTPRQATVFPGTTFYKEEWGTAYANYDPDKANSLLDELGMKWDKDHQYRLRPDGNPLTISMEVYPYASVLPVTELVKEYWGEVGIRGEIKVEDYSFWWGRLRDNKADLGIWVLDGVMETRLFANPHRLLPTSWNVMGLASEWGLYQETQGKEGEKPPEEILRLYQLAEEWQTSTTDEDYKMLGQQLVGLHSDLLMKIGTVGMAKNPIVIKNSLRNVPSEGYFGSTNGFWQSYMPAQWFFKN